MLHLRPLRVKLPHHLLPQRALLAPFRHPVQLHRRLCGCPRLLLLLVLLRTAAASVLRRGRRRRPARVDLPVRGADGAAAAASFSCSAAAVDLVGAVRVYINDLEPQVRRVLGRLARPPLGGGAAAGLRVVADQDLGERAGAGHIVVEVDEGADVVGGGAGEVEGHGGGWVGRGMVLGGGWGGC